MLSAEGFIQKHRLINKQEKVLIGVSGGMDSVALANFLHQIGYKIGIAHVNYQLRGNNSNLDMELVENLANKLNVKFHLIKKTKPESSVNTQLWARSLRYEFFNDLCFEFGYEKIATAHHSNDSLETMLINLSRGTGINGLSGIPKQRGNIVRPFLETTRQDIEAYVEEHNLEYREDMRNHQSDYLRNIFRNQVLPILEDYDGDILKKLTASNKNLKDDSHALNELCQAFVATHFNGQTINLTEIPESVRATVLYHILRPYGFNRNQCLDIVEAFSGSMIETASHVANKKGDQLIITTKSYETEHIHITTEGLFRCNGQTLALAKHAFLKDKMPRKPTHVWADSIKVGFPLVWKTVDKGERFQPLGATYFVDVFDYLKDAGFDQTTRKRVMAIYDSSERIVWIPNVQLSEHVKCDAITARVLSLNLSIDQNPS